MIEAIFNSEPILAVTPEMIADLKARAAAAPRKRFRLCLHHSTDDLIQEMVIVVHRDSVMPPHRHPVGRSESYHLIEGSMVVCFFDDNGQVIKRIEMAEPGQGAASLYRLSGSVWHAPVQTSEWLVYHEALTGPFVREEVVEFPAWMPAETEISEMRRFLAQAAGLE